MGLLLQDLLTVHDIDALLQLADALAGNIVDSIIVPVLVPVNISDSGSTLASEEVSLDTGGSSLIVSLAGRDSCSVLCQIEAYLLAFGLSQHIHSAVSLSLRCCTLQFVFNSQSSQISLLLIIIGTLQDNSGRCRYVLYLSKDQVCELRVLYSHISIHITVQLIAGSLIIDGSIAVRAYV